MWFSATSPASFVRGLTRDCCCRRQTSASRFAPDLRLVFDGDGDRPRSSVIFGMVIWQGAQGEGGGTSPDAAVATLVGELLVAGRRGRLTELPEFDRVVRSQTMDAGAPVSSYTVMREFGQLLSSAE